MCKNKTSASLVVLNTILKIRISIVTADIAEFQTQWFLS
jgi:hypothetical protein